MSTHDTGCCDPDGGEWTENDSALFTIFLSAFALFMGIGLLLTHWVYAVILIVVLAVFGVGMLVGLDYAARRFFDSY